MKKRALSLILALVMCQGLTVPALAAPKSNRYTSAGGYTVNVTRAPAALEGSQHKGEGVFVKEVDKTYTFYDVNGNTLGTGSGYTLMGQFHDGRAPVKAYNAYTAQEGYGYIDRTGAVVISAQFDDARNFDSGRACVKKGGQKFYIDTAGNRGIPGDFLEYSDFSDGIALVAVPAQYTGNGGELKHKHWQLIDINGSVIYDFPAEWHDYMPTDVVTGAYQRDTIEQKGQFRYGWLLIENEQGKRVLMDKTGTQRAIPELDGANLVAYLGNDRLLVQKNAMRAIVDMNGTMLMPYLYDYMELRCEDYFRYGVTRLSEGTSQQGIIDSAGNIVVPTDWGGSMDELVDGMAVGFEWDYTGGFKTYTYLFWVSDCPYGPGASGQKPIAPPVNPQQPTEPPADPQPEVKTANPSNDKLTVNGVEGTPTVYNIDDSNYFKIRDVAALLNGTEKQFSVGYDAEKQSVTATTGQGYEKLPADLAGAPAGAGEAKASGDAIYVNGTKITPTVYNINGNNYFKLRDLGQALDFYIGWSLERGVYIETDKPYAG